MAEEVKLLGRRLSPFSTRVAIALNLKEVSYEFVKVEIFGQKSEILLECNPVYKKIPVLIHHGKPICESMIILQYIDDVWARNPSILPSHPYYRAIARFWVTYIDNNLLITIWGMMMAASKEAAKEAAGRAAEILQTLEEAFKQCSQGKDFFGGDAIGYLDIALGSFLGPLKAGEKLSNVEIFDEKTVPLLVGWAERFSKLDAVKEVLADAEEYIEMVQSMNDGVPTV
ncbi:Glutathione S-transferase [Musa troglodytarum]|uniref:glutathione transferase n=1 Tax=Musa troglodytarum TaxID=320322 RepID=A0A9E7FRD4_9LILI|nr:Glutathione S-transferase [Musa troglodytarum]URD99641.1 Glutathione S-transferase [Musa troglodytarum]